MNTSPSLKTLAQTTSILLAIAALLMGATSRLYSDEPKSDAQPSKTNAADTKAKSPDPKPAVHQLTGAELYSIHCNRCHPERYPTERTGAQWKTIMLHMQVRANIPVSQSRLILQYLQDNSGR